jgi:putative autoinducer-2 (AI-2) aldolase
MTEDEDVLLDMNDDLYSNSLIDTGTPFLKGTENSAWGIKNRLSRIFNSKTDRTVMLAFDHGSIMDTDCGLDNIKSAVLPLIQFADSLVCTRGIVRTIVPPSTRKPICLRFSVGSTSLTEYNNDTIIDIEDALRLNASALAVNVSIGDKYEVKTLANLSKAADFGSKYDIPVMGVMSVSKQDKDSVYYSLAARVCAENGASIIKAYYVEKNFSKIINTCPVPVVVAGGKKVSEQKFFEICYHAIESGAAGIEVGRNVFQSSSPIAVLKAISAIVHDNLLPDDAFQLFKELSNNS